MLFVDAGNDRVGIGMTPATDFHIKGVTTIDGDGSSRTEITSSTASSIVSLNVGGFDGSPSVARDVRFFVNAASNAKTEAMRLESNQDAAFLGNLTIPEKITHTGDADTFLQFNAADTFRIVAGDEERFRVATGEVVVNESSVDTDFRVEGNGNTHMLFVDAGNDLVGVGQSSPASYNGSFNDLVVGASSATGITVVSGTTAAGTLAFADGTSGDAAYRGFVQYNHNTDELALGSAGATALTIAASAAIKTTNDSVATTAKVTGNKASIADNVATSFAKLVANNNEIHGHLTFVYNIEDPGNNIGVGTKTFRVFFNGGTTLLDAIQSDTTIFNPTITATASGTDFTLKIQMDVSSSTYSLDYSLEFLAHNSSASSVDIVEV